MSKSQHPFAGGSVQKLTLWGFGGQLGWQGWESSRLSDRNLRRHGSLIEMRYTAMDVEIRLFCRQVDRMNVAAMTEVVTGFRSPWYIYCNFPRACYPFAQNSFDKG